ncbi:MAG: fatty acid desaturase family protein [Halieaceae bacterium]|nr:fatty acid desaturase family protein [Halieaceae bacterium]
MEVSDYLSRDEVLYFTRRSDWRAWGIVLGNWLLISAIFLVAAIWPHPLIIIAAVILLAGRQMGLAVLMHECGHGTFFKSKALNDFVGQWLCALPTMNDQPSYASGHLEHHRKAGTQADPDLSNYQAYPISRESFKRKVIRDLTGQTGYKLISLMTMRLVETLKRGDYALALSYFRPYLAQLLLLLVLSALGIPWAYLLWVTAYMTFFMLIIRVRQVAEHAAVPDLYDPDTRLNTRSVDAPWWQRWAMVPIGVNYHLEHHFMASVPCYRLRALRELLKRRHALDNVPAFKGYGALLKHVVAA